MSVQSYEILARRALGNTATLLEAFVAQVFSDGKTGSTLQRLWTTDQIHTPLDGCPVWDENGLSDFRLEHPASLLKSAVGTDTNNPCAAGDWLVVVVLFLGVLTINWTTRWFFWQPLAHVIARVTEHKGWSHMDARKFAMNATQATFFAAFSFFSYRVIAPQPWLAQPDEWFSDENFEEPAQERFHVVLKFYFLLYTARIFSDWVSLHFEIGRNWEDFGMFWIHHVVTLLLLYTAMTNPPYVRLGCVILFFFDWADVPLLAAKAFKYLSSDRRDYFQWMANRLFEVFAVIFFLSRVVLFDSVIYLCFTHVDAWGPLGLLIALAALQTYWMSLIVLAAVQMIANGGVVEDVRETSTAKLERRTKKYK